MATMSRESSKWLSLAGLCRLAGVNTSSPCSYWPVGDLPAQSRSEVFLDVLKVAFTSE